VLTDRRHTIGAMCHIVHCRPRSQYSGNPGNGADGALDSLYGLVRARGFSPALCEAYVYGGGNMFPELVDGLHVGERNAEYVLARLRADGVRVVAQDVGGTTYRRLAWTVGSGQPQVTAVPV
jgi:chemotaxis protein CheD